MVFNDFKKDCKIKNVITDFSQKETEFSIYVYCLEVDINLEKEKRLTKLYYKHGLSYEMHYGLIQWEPQTGKK